jgi:TolB protein
MWQSVSAFPTIAMATLVQWHRSQKLGRKQLLPWVMAFFLLAGCTNADLARFLITPTAPAATGATTIDPTMASRNRLLVQGADGNLFTINPDGTDRFDLTTDASRNRTYSQATWSTTGAQIGWARVDETTAGFRSALITSRADGRARNEVETTFAPFYLYWSPDDSKLAYLSNWISQGNQTIALQLLDVANNSTAPTVLGTGQPFYFSWSPDGAQMITHVAGEQIALLTVIDGAVQSVSNVSASFAAPQWSATGDQLLYATAIDNVPQLLLTDVAGEKRTLITNLSRNDSVSFSLNQQATHLAYVETSDQVGFSAFGPLFLYDIAAEEFTQLSDGPVLVFAWSPDGQALFFLTAEPAGERVWLRVNIWDGEGVRRFARFAPSPVLLRTYLPFADQYMQSLRFWSPDSRAVVYAGQSEEGERGVWVQPVQGDNPAQLVAEGLFATWSPQ